MNVAGRQVTFTGIEKIVWLSDGDVTVMVRVPLPAAEAAVKSNT
jgi:hypothetical protein